MERQRAAELLDRFRHLKVMVVGDYFLDEYIVGRAERLSREGPVPVLGFRRRFCLPGGAGNPVRNIAALGGSVVAVGVTGTDEAAAELKVLLGEGGPVDTRGLVSDSSRPTSVKTRIVAEGLSSPHQVARIDRLDRRPVDAEVAASIAEHVMALAPGNDAILVSHYRSGVVVPAVCAAARGAAAEAGAWLTVDAQGDLSQFEGFRVVRVGRQDVDEALGRRLQTEDDFVEATSGLLDALGAAVVMVGRGAEGMSVATRVGSSPTTYFTVHPTNVSEVFDVSGAGDTVIAVTTLALAAGSSVQEAVMLANVAAGIVVRRLGVAAPTADEILAEWPAAA